MSLTAPRTIGKVERAFHNFRNLVWEPIADVSVEYAETDEHLRSPGEAAKLSYKPAASGTTWGHAWGNAWFRGVVELPSSCNGREVFIAGVTGGKESLVFVNGNPAGMLTAQTFGEYGNHAAVRIAAADENAGRRVDIAIESYAWHPCVECMPGDLTKAQAFAPGQFVKTFQSLKLVLRRDDVAQMCVDLHNLLMFHKALDEHHPMKGRAEQCLLELFTILPQHPLEVPESAWRSAVAQARDTMKPIFASRNGTHTPYIGLVGHSHMDTAWLWPISETIRKCARTYANALAMMDQYPEYIFIQSAPLHTEWMRDFYPDIFRRMKQRVQEGRWEPNGGMYVEPDCNLTGGESMIRQFLVGQKVNEELYGYRSDSYWQPDVFGYSSAIPQIMKGCGIDYFLTTKLGGNDTNKFPYDCFIWKGQDGTEVISHFNAIHNWPDTICTMHLWNNTQHHDVQDRRLFSYGYGDGGGGPFYEMIESARRIEDLQGCPKTKHTTVSKFMKDLDRETRHQLPIWFGELYFEAHRGTLTSIHGIKRGNRKCEIAMRNAELTAVLASLGRDASPRPPSTYPHAKLLTLWKTLLTNQFHDILPGSSISEVNVQAIREFAETTAGAESITHESLAGITAAKQGAESIALFNPLSWTRADEHVLEGVATGKMPAEHGLDCQWITDVEGRTKLIVGGVKLPSLGGVVLALKSGQPDTTSPFKIEGDTIKTPYSVLRFDKAGRIVSFLDRTTGREVAREHGVPLNTFWMGEDIPQSWDNWDVDAEQQLKMQPVVDLVSRDVVANGPLQLRIRSVYRLSEKSSLTQDIVLHAGTPRVDFETVLEWNEVHTLLKAGFDVDILSERARHEMQFGHLDRPAHDNRSIERAQFEVCNHRWTDFSESRFGVAILNDCKYGISVRKTEMRLTLAKSGNHPDYTAGAGRQVFSYALLPHAGFSAESVIRPGYEFNVPAITVAGAAQAPASLLEVSAPNVIVEAVKWAEKGNAFVVRLYEAERNRTKTTVKIGVPVKAVTQVNMLEENPVPIPLHDGKVDLDFRAFEIKTLRIEV